MDTHLVSLPTIILIVTVIAIGMGYGIRTIHLSRRYPDRYGRSTGLRDFKLNAPWWSEVTKFQMEQCGQFAEEDYTNFVETGFVSSLMKAGYEVRVKKDKSGMVTVSYKNWADDVY